MAVPLKIKKVYYSRVRWGEQPIRFTAKQPKGVGTTVYATIYLDPILKHHPDLRNALLKHEIAELKAWGAGSTRAHTIGKSKESKLLRQIGGVSGFWREIKRREVRRR